MDDKQDQKNSAANLIRRKIEAIYAHEEPDLKTEASEAKNSLNPSRHQNFINNLVNSGKDVATIQTEWHNYYVSLSEEDKKQVWKEFYESNKNLKKPSEGINSFEKNMAKQKNEVIASNHYKPSKRNSLTQNLHSKITSGGRLKLKHQIQSLFFGLGLGIIVIFIFMFGFFNEVFIAPLIQPSRNITAVPIIVGSDNLVASPTPQVIIPKINVQIPVQYNVNTTNESTIENFLQDGVVHYPTTVLPGQLGNAAFFGYSSNNIFNPGKYKFAFVLLHTLRAGDTFYLTYNSTLYVYKVIYTKIVSPSDVSVLGPVNGQKATATLITCDPPGTSINRLIVVGQQISPSVSNDSAPSQSLTNFNSPSYLPGNGPTLWDRFINSIEGKVIVVVVPLGLIVYILRKINKNRKRY